MFKESGIHFNEESPVRSFEEQFKDLREVRLPSGTAEVADLTPEKTEGTVPVLLSHAWGLDLKTYKAAVQQLYDDDNHVVSFVHPRIGSALDSSMNVEKLSVNPKNPSEKYPTAELRKALNTLEVLEELGIEKVDAIAHSEAALNIIYAAMMYPEKFRSIVFFNPAGMMEEETWSRLGKGFASQGTRVPSLKDVPITESERAVGAAAGKAWIKYILKNPFRAISEVSAIKRKHREVKDLLPYLHDLGINIAVVSAEDDPVFPHEEIEKAAQMDAVNTFVSVPGGHGVLGDRPDIAMPSVESIFKELAKRERTPEQKQALADREYQSGVRYIPGEGLVIAPYIKNKKAREA
jgi:pimeloyl-ACP methyl ester carboxylesterase